MKIMIKPLSVNKCWQGRRFKTKEYKDYEKLLLRALPDITIPEPPFEVVYEFGFSSSASDLDNPVKPFQDILQKRYGFNDKDIELMTVRRHKVKKGLDFISFEIKNKKT